MTTGTSSRLRLPARVLVPVVLGTLLNALNSSMIAVALVRIQHAFHAGSSVLWLVSSFYLAAAVGQPAMGLLADHLGARRVFCAGMLVVMATVLLASWAPSLGWLVATRVLLGIGTSTAFPAGLALIRNWAARYAPGAAPTGGLGAISIAAQAAVALGPPLGGVLTQFAGWQAVFWVNLPVAGLSLVLTLLWLGPDGPVRTRRPRDLVRELDPLGMGLFTVMLVCLLLTLISAKSHVDWWPLLPAAAATAALLRWETRATRPFVDVRMLAVNRPLSLTYLRTTVTYVVFYAIFYGLPQWFEHGRGLSTLGSGLTMLPVALLGMVSTLIATRLTGRRGVPVVLIVGSAGLVVGSLALLGVSRATPLLVVLVIGAVLGLPNGFNSLGNQSAMYTAAPHSQLATASGLYRTSQYVGANFASVLVAMTLGQAATDAGLHLMAVLISVISLGLLVAAVLSVRRPRTASA